MKFLAWFLAGLLLWLGFWPGLALGQEAADTPLVAQPVLAVIPAIHNHQTETACSESIYQTLIRWPAYQVLPDWYILQKLEQAPERWQNDWQGLFERLPEAEYALLAQVTTVNSLPVGPHQATQQLVGILLARQPTPHILRSEVLPLQSPLDCEKLARHLMGQPEQERFRNPALSGVLSLLIPGAGHFYRGQWDGVAMGAGFLGAYLTLAFLGFSDVTSPQVSSSQWGGFLVLLSLLDVVTAYFMAQPGPQI